VIFELQFSASVWAMIYGFRALCCYFKHQNYPSISS